MAVRDSHAARVLLIGAYKPLLRALQRGLEEEGFAADMIAPGQERSAGPFITDYEVVVIDLKRPDPAALQVVWDWRRLGVSTPVIVLTVPGANGHTCHAETAVDAWLSKPLDLDQFLACVRDLSHVSAACQSSGVMSRTPLLATN
jgi:DNA-binding response OmpR family regulator